MAGTMWLAKGMRAISRGIISRGGSTKMDRDDHPRRTESMTISARPEPIQSISREITSRDSLNP